MDLFEAMETNRAIRHLRSDPVPDELVSKLIHAATRAPSPGNSQGWDFVVVRDPATRARIRDLIAPRLAAVRGASGVAANSMTRAADHLVDSLGDVPVLIFVCGAPCYPPAAPQEAFVWSTLYPATQNLLLAARALGLGATMTAFHLLAERPIRELLGIPDSVKVVAMIPVGWPARPFGLVKRKAIEQVIHREKW